MNKSASRTNAIKNGASRIVHRTVCWLGDRVTDWSGYAAIRMSLEKANGPRERTLDLPGYVQINSYCCAAVTAAMVVRYFRPQMSFGRIYAIVNPSQEYGAGSARVSKAVRACGLHVSHQHRLTFEQVCSAIKQGRPILAIVHNPGAENSHWVVIYGYGRCPDRLFIAFNGMPWCGRNRIPRREFERIWSPRGNGIICWKNPVGVRPSK